LDLTLKPTYCDPFSLLNTRKNESEKKTHQKNQKIDHVQKPPLENTKSTMEKHDYWIFPTRIFQINMCVGVINVFE